MDIEKTEEKDNDQHFKAHYMSYILELVEHLRLSDVNLIYDNFVDLESKNVLTPIDSICLNLCDETWINFENLSKIFFTENEEMVWLACCFYLAYEKISFIFRRKFTEEYQDSQNQLLNNKKQSIDNQIISKIDQFPFFSILKLLKHLKIDLSKFMKIINKLIEILNVPTQLTSRLTNIESNYNVASVLYEKYDSIFKNTFNHSYEYLIGFFANDQHAIDSKFKIKSQDFFTFGWLLFINVKNQFPQIGNDLVNSYHLLICCINHMYQVTQNLNQQYLLRICINRKNGLKSLKSNKFIDYICKKYDGNSIEAKTVNEYYFRPQIKKILSDKADDLEFLDILCSKLDHSYEKILFDRNDNATNVEQNVNLDIDERILLRKFANERENVSIDKAEKFIFSIEIPNCLKPVNDLDNFEHDSMYHKYKFEFQKIVDLFKTLFINDVMKNFNESRLDDLPDIKENIIYLLNEFFIIIHKFYLFSIKILISSEKKRIGSDCFIEKLYENESFHKSVYICCFEILLNSSLVTKSAEFSSKKQKIEHVELLSLIQLRSDQFSFPYSIKNLKLEPIDLLRIIELFISNTSIDNQTNLTYLNKPIVKHLNSIEESILEHLSWSKESKLWSLIKRLKLACSNPNSQNELTQLNFAFPLYDEVGFMSSSQSSGSSGNTLTTAVLTNSKTEASSSKPTITRVVCSTNSSTTTTVSSENMILSTKTLPTNSTKQIQFLTLTPTGSRSKNCKQGRLLNMTNFLTYFFRKFYNLANLRLRNLIEKLNLNNLLDEPNSNQTSSAQILTPVASTSTPILTPVTSSNIKPALNLNSEKHQLLLKKIWNIFEFSLSSGIETSSCLIQSRHLDQMLLCAVYLACKISNIPILFTQILKTYKSLRPQSSSIYRDVLLDHGELCGDLIQFYNKIYIEKMKEFAFNLQARFQGQMNYNSDNKVTLTPIDNLFLLSPVPRPAQINLNINLQFTPRKILDNRPVFISPIKDRLVPHTTQFIQQINSKYSGRNKLVYTCTDIDSNKVILQINEMIKKNDVKIRTSNKRLFSEISSHCLTVNTLSTKTSTNTEDERDGRVKITRINSFGSSQPRSVHSNAINNHSSSTNSNFLSKIVSSKLGSTSNSNLVTMVVGSSSNQNQAMNISLPLGANFAKHIQTIQNERTNVN